jgi:hypothetical protein
MTETQNGAATGSSGLAWREERATRFRDAKLGALLRYTTIRS